jgi:hypothetical protein
MLRKITSILTAAVLATGISIATAAPSSAITISDGSTVTLVSTAASMTSCQTTLTSISATTRVRNWTSGDNIDFSFVGAASFVWGSTHDAAFTQALNLASATRGTFTPVTGTTYTFYRLREGTTSANYFCRPGEVNLLVNGTDAITGWVVSPTTFFTSGGSTGNATDPMAAARAYIEAERVRLAAIAAAQVVLQGVLKGDKPGTIAQYSEANFTIPSEAVLTRVNAALLKMPADLRVKSDEITKVIKLESLVVQISTAETQKKVTVTHLISTGFLAKENGNKSILTYLLKNQDPLTLDSKEKIAAVITEEIAAIKARKARFAAIQEKIAARNK